MVAKDLDKKEKEYLLLEIEKLNKEFNMSFDVACLLEKDRVRLNLVGPLNGVPKYFKISSRDINDLPRLLKEKYKKFKALELSKG